jgi:thiamine biosynthesis lipoprotein
MNAGETVTFSPEGTRMLELAEQIHVASGGAFSLLWQGGTLEHAADGWRVAGGRAGLGAILKGFLADRAADALVASGLDDFVVDAAGDVVAHGPGDTGRGWRVTVVSEDEPIAKVILRDAALSTSGGDQQPGHIKDPRTGEPVTCSRVATVVAPRGEIADALATATYASCGQRGLAERFGAKSLWIGADGSRRWSRGARRVFRR